MVSLLIHDDKLGGKEREREGRWGKRRISTLFVMICFLYWEHLKHREQNVRNCPNSQMRMQMFVTFFFVLFLPALCGFAMHRFKLLPLSYTSPPETRFKFQLLHMLTVSNGNGIR